MKTRADLLIEAGQSIKMQESAGLLEPVFKFGEKVFVMLSTDFNHSPELYAFPVAVVEGRPVFEGDELYWLNSGEPVNANPLIHENTWKCFTWTKPNPKPKTVMVELTVDQAELITKYGLEYGITLACRKALEGVK